MIGSCFSPGSWLSRLPSYNRIDIGVNYGFNLFNTKAKVGFSCFNLTNHSNVKYLQYIYAIPTAQHGSERAVNTVVGSETGLLDRTYNVSLKIDF